MPAERAPSLSVLFPAYNDSGTNASKVVQAMQAARALTDDFEVIVVNDGSRDKTQGAFAAARATECPNAGHLASTVLSLPLNPGLSDGGVDEVAGAVARALPAGAGQAR
jgi:glycosyltransferase involved in cell wall biosynthesis